MYNGRYFGGGVSELVSSESKELTILYHLICREDIDELVRMFKEGVSEKEVIRFVNSRTIAMEMGKDEVEKLEEVRLILIKRRSKEQAV